MAFRFCATFLGRRQGFGWSLECLYAVQTVPGELRPDLSFLLVPKLARLFLMSISLVLVQGWVLPDSGGIPDKGLGLCGRTHCLNELHDVLLLVWHVAAHPKHSIVLDQLCQRRP